jgi:hypothetical protein
VGTAAGFDSNNAIGRQDALTDKELGVLPRIYVIRNDSQIEGGPKRPAQHVNQRSLPASNRPGDANAKRVC